MSEEQDMATSSGSPLQHQRPDSPTESHVSMESYKSMGEPPSFGNKIQSPLQHQRPDSPTESHVSMKSGKSMGEPPSFSSDVLSPLENQRADSPAESYSSMKSDKSKGEPPSFSNEVSSPHSGAESDSSAQSDRSKGEPPSFGNKIPSAATKTETDDDKKNPITDLKMTIREKYGEQSNQETDAELFEAVKRQGVKINYGDMFKVRTVLTAGGESVGQTFQTRMFMLNRAKGNTCKDIDSASKRREKLVTRLRQRLLKENSQPEDPNHPNQANTEHIIREDSSAEVTDGQKKKQTVVKVKATSDILKHRNGEKIRAVLTVGEANIGKTFHVRKFIKEWAENKRSFVTRAADTAKGLFGKANNNELIIFPLSICELNSIKDQEFSLVGLLNHFFKETKEFVISDFSKFPVLFVLDGIDQFESQLDFDIKNPVTDVSERASVDVLLTNLIKGNLLPSAQVWITSRPSAVNWLNADKLVYRRTEIREINDKEKLKTYLKSTILKKHEKQNKQETDTELCVQVKDKDELVQTNYGDMFKVRTVLTAGVPGVGKTFQTRMFMLNWAKGNTCNKIDLVASLDFSKLNKCKGDVQSMEDLLNDHFRDVKQQLIPSYDEFTVLFVLDGLEQCELPLDFVNNKELSDMKKKASMDELLTNLIKGTLLPSAHLWIISQPSGVDKIPPEYIQKVTKCQETSKRREKLVTRLRQRLLKENSQPEDHKPPNQANTEHIIREDSSAEVTDEQKEKQTVVKVKATSDIFKHRNGEKIGAVLTVGEADIGKTFHVRKFIKEWAENKRSFVTRAADTAKGLFGKANNNELIIFPLSICELNSIKDREFSLVGLLNHFFKETKEFVISDFSKFPVLFVLDGIDKFESQLDFDIKNPVTDVSERASVDVLLTNLIKGNLLPSAQVWITSRPSAVNWLNADKLVYRRTEIREKPDITSQRNLKSQLKHQFTCVSEGIDRQEASAVLNEIYTELYIIDGQSEEVNNQQESNQIQNAKFKPEKAVKYNEIFESVEKKPIKTVMTLGVAGVGKTIASMKYMLDWAEGKAIQNINYMFPLPFRELNLRRDKEQSFEELLHQFFPPMKTSEISDYGKYQILIVLDGFDECRLDLDFSENVKCTDVKEPRSVNVLLTNLIQGNLLRGAQIWITSRPAASNHIPAKKVDRVTEVRGFNDEQKEEYFRKRFKDKNLAEKILSHVKKSRSLYIMCHIPVFCWITSVVLKDYVSTNQEDEMPKTLTDMYTYFLLLECRQANRKYSEGETCERRETDECWNERNKETIVSLGKLAFEELVKGNFLFAEENLTERGIDVTNAAVFSGMFTQIKREGPSLYQQKLFCFVHLSIQEFLAAFYVFHIFNNEGENLLTEPPSVVSGLPASDFYKKAVDKALDSKDGNWDLFLRFLLGLSLETNQKHLKELLKDNRKNNKETNKETAEYIKKKINDDISDADKNLNLFYCLNELNDHSLVKDIKKQLRSGTQNFEAYSAGQWSALTFVLLTSDEKLDVFDLKNYWKSEKVLLGMLPVVQVSKITLLSWCDLSEQSCSRLTSSVLSSAFSNLSELDFSHNDLLDSGVEHLAEGLRSPHCKLEVLKLAGCQVTERGCSSLALSLESNTASPLKHLDLRYNHPGDGGTRRLTDIVENPNTSLRKLHLEHGGEHRLKPGFKKYGVKLKFDETTASKRLLLEGDRKARTVENVEEKPARPDNEGRFKRSQVFCDEGLEGVCYWEVEWSETVNIAAAYERVGREWDSSGGLGCNENSWGLYCSRTECTAMHGKTSKSVGKPSSQKIAVLLDWEGGTLSYYSVSSEKLSLIHTFKARFTEPLFPAFWFKTGSVTLCDLD